MVGLVFNKLIISRARVEKTLALFVSAVGKARTISTSLVPIPKATAPIFFQN